MSAYLEIAERVLSESRRPLAAKTILDIAYQNGLVPDHLYGETQHKTLQARISEDIVELRERSRFFRTEPGKFFLRHFLHDASLPEQFRQPVPTRRRARQLKPKYALGIPKAYLSSFRNRKGPIEPGNVYETLLSVRPIDTKSASYSDDVLIWSFAIVRRGSLILTYRSGAYREDRDSFLLRRSIGFSAVVEPSDQTLFNQRALGIPERGINAAKTDLEILGQDLENAQADLYSDVRYFVYSEQAAALIGVVYYECPIWFEPTRRRLSMHDVRWHAPNISINNIEDFDPWSQLVLKAEIGAET